jgi:glucosyl-dolichyl phosphate glucuronosyltransferase
VLEPYRTSMSRTVEAVAFFEANPVTYNSPRTHATVADTCRAHSQDRGAWCGTQLPIRTPMTLDVVVPTYNRSNLVRKTINSLLRAPLPEGLEVNVYVVDNNSTDDTREVVRECQQGAPLPVHYVLEKTQGSSTARNAGIAAGRGELIGFVDDDEEIEQNWYRTACREFSDPAVDYIGGPCLLNKDVSFPDWFPPGYHSAVGMIPAKPRGFYGPNHTGMLNGGNAILRRTVFDRIGVFSTKLGRSAKNLLSEEDADLFRRLQAGGLRGVYVPELIILHHLHENRLTRGYHRRWAYWRAVSQGVLDRDVQEDVPYLLGVPRYKVGRAIRGLISFPKHRLSKSGKGQAFADELASWDLVGFVYGKYFFHEPRHYVTRNVS